MGRLGCLRRGGGGAWRWLRAEVVPLLPPLGCLSVIAVGGHLLLLWAKRRIRHRALLGCEVMWRHLTGRLAGDSAGREGRCVSVVLNTCGGGDAVEVPLALLDDRSFLAVVCKCYVDAAAFGHPNTGLIADCWNLLVASVNTRLVGGAAEGAHAAGRDDDVDDDDDATFFAVELRSFLQRELANTRHIPPAARARWAAVSGRELHVARLGPGRAAEVCGMESQWRELRHTLITPLRVLHRVMPLRDLLVAGAATAALTCLLRVALPTVVIFTGTPALYLQLLQSSVHHANHDDDDDDDDTGGGGGGGVVVLRRALAELAAAALWGPFGEACGTMLAVTSARELLAHAAESCVDHVTRHVEATLYQETMLSLAIMDFSTIAGGDVVGTALRGLHGMRSLLHGLEHRLREATEYAAAVWSTVRFPAAAAVYVTLSHLLRALEHRVQRTADDVFRLRRDYRGAAHDGPTSHGAGRPIAPSWAATAPPRACGTPAGPTTVAAMVTLRDLTRPTMW